MQLKGLLRQSWKDVGKKLQTRLCAATEGNMICRLQINKNPFLEN